MAAEFKIGRLRFTWAGAWAGATFYNRDAVVEYNGKTYVCIEPHTSDADFYADLYHVTLSGASTPYWQINLDGNTWKGDWQTGQFYSLGNLLVFGGAVYQCILEHTSTTFDADIAKWVVYLRSDKWNNGWQTNTLYGLNDVVSYGGIVYRCITTHNSAATSGLGLEADLSKWQVVVSGIIYVGDFQQVQHYRLNDVVKLGSDLYIAIQGHNSAGPFDNTKWSVWLPGVEYSTTWANGNSYQIGDVVKYGGYSYISDTNNNTGNTPSTSSVNWTLLTTGFNMRDDWNSGQSYKVGDVVRKGGNLFVAVSDSSGQDPTAFIVPTSYVALGSSGTVVEVTSVAGIVPGMIVSGTGFTQGQTVISVDTLTSTVILSSEPNATPLDSQSLKFIGVNYVFWSIVTTGEQFKGFWENATVYSVGETVVWANGTYKCIQTHQSSSVSQPDMDVVHEYWILESPHARRNAGTTAGDIVARDNNSTNVPVEIGTEDFVLRASGTTPAWAYVLSVPDVYYVAPNGIDDPDYGSTWDQPWASIKYACETIAAGFNFTNANYLLKNNKEFLIAEMYAWMLDQKATNSPPFSSASVFDEFSTKRDAGLIIDAISYDITRGGNTRAVSMALAYFSSTSNTEFRTTETDAAQQYIVASLNKLKLLMVDVTGNNLPTTNYQQKLITWNSATTYQTGDQIFYQGDYYESVIDSNLNEDPTISLNWVVITTTPATVVDQLVDLSKIRETNTDILLVDLMTIIIDPIEAADTRLVPQLYGSNTATIMVKTGTYEEVFPIIVPDNVAINGDELRGAVVKPKNAAYTLATRSFSATNKFNVATVEGMAVDMPVQFSVVSANDAFSGITLGATYYIKAIDTVAKTITVASSIGGAAVSLANGAGQLTVYAGDCLVDMFYVRNASGIRNLTLTGLAGSLTTPNSFGTRRPTGPSYVSLDPGTGPDDTSVWITKRSPYIQNVTTFGVGSTGMKIDGYLHNGGNKSIVCNDFTQIISDGIGVWCTGPSSLTECVSVFSYYGYAGYFAEDGGRIRATNGNSSYGTYGVVAEGFDPTESPITGLIDNQSQQVQANVQSSFGTQAQLLSLTYGNAGSDYTELTTNMLYESNHFDGGEWVTDGNINSQQNVLSPIDESNGWTLTGLTSSTDSSYIYQDVAIPAAGYEYTGLSSLNVTGSGSSATFDITVRSTAYFASVNVGGTGYVVGSQLRILGSELGGLNGVNDCFLTITSLAGSSIVGVSVTGVVPEGSAQPHTFSVYAKKGTSTSFDMEIVYSGSETVSSSVNFNFDTASFSASNNGTNGLVPVSFDKLSLTNGWYRIWMTVYDSVALNTSLRVKLYPRGKTGFSGSTRFYGTQLQLSATPTFYFESTSASRYSSYADFYIKGAGTGAVAVGEEIRAGGVFQTRITDTGSGSGGRGYLTSSNNAQGGSDTAVILAQSDINLPNNYQSQRVFINSGTGAGQYGYISSYNTTSKIAYVLKESFTPLVVTASDAATDELTTSSAVDSLYVNQPVQFIPTYYTTTISTISSDTIAVTQTVGGTTNTVIVGSTAKLDVNMPVQFTGMVFGGVISGFTYYIKEIIDNVSFTLSTSQFGQVLLLNNAIGTMTMEFAGYNSYLRGPTIDMIPNMPITFTGTAIGGIVVGTTYYVKDVLTANTFTIASSLITSTITATANTTDEITTSGLTSSLNPLDPIVFTGTVFGNIVAGQKYYISNIVNSTKFTITDALLEQTVLTTTATTNVVSVSDLTGFIVDNPVVFRGNTFGNIVKETVYYILALDTLTNKFTISLSPGGSAVNLITDTGEMTVYTPDTRVTLASASGSMTATSTNAKTTLSFAVGTMIGTYSTNLFGNVVAGTTYYVESITEGSPNKFTISETSGPGGVFALKTDTGSMNAGASGWDHINPGTPIAANLDNSSVYYIEPRLKFASPTFSTAASTTPTISPSTSWIGMAYGNKTFIAIPSGNAIAAKTTNGTSWTSVALPYSTTWTDIAYGNNYWVAISNDSELTNTGSRVAISTSNGNGWRLSQLPSKTTWNKVAYGNGKFVAIATGTTSAAYSTDFGQTWQSGTSLPSQTWTGLAYGAGRFVAIASGTSTAAYSTNGIAWTSATLPSSSDWESITYGNGLFVAVSSSGATAIYSRDGITWIASVKTLPALNKVVYGQGVFLALASSSTTAYTSEDAQSWTPRTVTSATYGAAAFGFVNSVADGIFVTASDQTVGGKIIAGCTAKARASVTSGRITNISMWEPGSNYATAPPLTVTDPNITLSVTTQARISNGTLANPTFVNRGQDYNTNSTTIKINGGGFADTYQTGLTVIVKDLSALPGPGDNLTISGNSKIYKITNATVVYGTSAPNIKANIQISPDMSVALSPGHETAITIRTKYSQARLTGHDFLNIGYGNAIESNYPNVPEDTILSPQDQAVEVNFGRVFYTSTDQDGNFKVGDLFGVEQATGIVTLSASQFGLQGLETLSLGGISVGGSSVVVRQFSTDNTFIANSNEVIPTQRAIKAYLAGRLSQGGSNTFTGQLIAGTILVGGPDKISSTIPNGSLGSVINMPTLVKVDGQFGGWDGDGAALAFFMKSM